MTSMLFATALVFAIAYLIAPKRSNMVLRAAIKTVPVALLAAIATIEQLPALLVAALVLCALGDLLLAFARPPDDDTDLDIAFLAGLLAFLVGHLLYVALFAQTSFGTPGLAVWPVAAMMVVVALFVGGRLFGSAGSLRYPVAAYVLAILTMGLASLTTGSWLLVLGAALFMASDAILGTERFVLAADDKRISTITGPAIWVLYIAAQFTIVAAFL